MLRLWNFLRGYVIINVDGYFIEKFINLCANKGVYLWDIKRKMPHNMTLKVSINGFKALKGIAKKTRCRVEIKDKIGIPFVKYRYRRRKTFAAGAIVFFAVLYALTRFIWVIEVTGTTKVSPQEIVDYLAEKGIRPGIIKHQFEKESIAAEMLIKFDALSWVDVKTIGTKVVVDTVDRVPKPVIVDRSTPCNIFANKDGVIKSIITKNGVALVKEGDIVKKGKMLITGIVDNKFNPQEVRFVHSEGMVKATTWYQDAADVNLVEVKKEKSGEYKVGYSFKIFTDNYNIFRPNSPFQESETEEQNIRLAFWKDYELPIQFVVKKYHRLVPKQYTLTEEQAKEAAQKQALEKAQALVPQGIDVLDKKVVFETLNEGKTIRARAVLQCVEEIGYKEVIAKE